MSLPIDHTPEHYSPVKVGAMLALNDDALAKRGAKAIRDLLEINAELLAMLEELEWSNQDEYGHFCHFCDHKIEHAPDCRLAALLKKARNQ